MIFDTVQGALTIAGKRLTANLSPRDVLSAGYVFEREIDMKTGWVFRNTGKDVLGGHTVTPALGFHADQLKRVTVTFLDDTKDERRAVDRHRDFLARELGAPTRTSAHQVLYDYPWGQISAEADPRNGTSYIVVSWR
jgi:hypothetical protein